MTTHPSELNPDPPLQVQIILTDGQMIKCTAENDADAILWCEHWCSHGVRLVRGDQSLFYPPHKIDLIRWTK